MNDDPPHRCGGLQDSRIFQCGRRSLYFARRGM